MQVALTWDMESTGIAGRCWVQEALLGVHCPACLSELPLLCLMLDLKAT
jgi:hypothetical protein